MHGRNVVAGCLRHRILNPAVPPIESLDLAMGGQTVSAHDLGRDAIPPAPFALVIAAAFDSEHLAEWRQMFAADHASMAVLLSRWAREVWPQFLDRYGVTP